MALECTQEDESLTDLVLYLQQPIGDKEFSAWWHLWMQSLSGYPNLTVVVASEPVGSLRLQQLMCSQMVEASPAYLTEHSIGFPSPEEGLKVSHRELLHWGFGMLAQLSHEIPLPGSGTDCCRLRSFESTGCTYRFPGKHCPSTGIARWVCAAKMG